MKTQTTIQRGTVAPTYIADRRTAWRCLNCGAEHTFSSYVSARFYERLTHTCKCGHKHAVLEGNVTYAGH